MASLQKLEAEELGLIPAALGFRLICNPKTQRRKLRSNVKRGIAKHCVNAVNAYVSGF
jgi:hypothetical protein